MEPRSSIPQIVSHLNNYHHSSNSEIDDSQDIYGNSQHYSHEYSGGYENNYLGTNDNNDYHDTTGNNINNVYYDTDAYHNTNNNYVYHDIDDWNEFNNITMPLMALMNIMTTIVTNANHGTDDNYNHENKSNYEGD